MYQVRQNSPQLRQQPQISLLIACYNQIDMIELVFASLRKQSFLNFEVLICDDGSNAQFCEALTRLMQESSFSVVHLWHEDLGFRKNRILNWGLHHAQSDLLVFIDQDCILHPKFLWEHFSNFTLKHVLCGRRMELSPWISSLLTPAKIEAGFIEKNLWWILPAIALNKDNNGKKGIYIKNMSLRKYLNKKPRGIVGCNFSVAKENLLAINGFDTRYEGPGTGEDSDIEFRLALQGISTQPFVNTAVQYHIFHPIKIRPSANEAIFEQVQNEKRAQTSFGLQEQMKEFQPLLAERV